jgi:PAS domain S-box-containing protein
VTSFFRMSIRKQFLLATLIVALPTLMVIIYAGVEKRNEDIYEAREEIRQLTDSIASEQKNLVAGAQQLVGALAQLPDVRSHNAVKAQQILGDVLRMNPQYLNIAIADRSGRVWASALPAKTPYSVDDRRYFKNALATGQFSSGEYTIGRVIGKRTLSFGYPFKNQRGEIIGVISVKFDLDYFRTLLQQSKLPPGSNYLIIDYNGRILGRGINPAALIGKSVKQEVLRQMQEGPDGDFYTGKAVDGIERFSYYRKLRLAGEEVPYLYIRAGIPVKEVMAKANRALFRDLALLSAVMFTAFFLAWLIGIRSIVERVKLLGQASQQLARGDHDVRVSERVVGGELGTLGRTFDAMAHQLALRESELRESKEFLSTIIETEPACVKLLAADGSILMMNRAGLEMLQVESFVQVQGKSMYSFIDPDYLEAFKLMVTDAFDDKPGHLVFRILGAKGQPLWLETHAVPLRNDEGEIVSLLGITHNITERKEMERMKDEIISAVSHEMRTPLTAIVGYIQFIVENKLDEEQTKEYLGTVHKETERLRELINNFLDIQRLRAKKGFYDLKPLAARPLLEEAGTLFANASDKHRIAIDADTELPMILGDGEGLHRVLNNLLSNAIKYSPNGGNVILGANHDKTCVTLWVKDEGIGIPQEELARIFDRFYRVDNTARRTVGGTGLGLTLVREIVRAHGGRVWADSFFGKGSTFYVSLPAVATNPKFSH